MKHSYILRVVLVIIMKFHWFIGHVLQRRTVYYSPVDTHVGVAYNSCVTMWLVVKVWVDRLYIRV